MSRGTSSSRRTTTTLLFIWLTFCISTPRVPAIELTTLLSDPQLLPEDLANRITDGTTGMIVVPGMVTTDIRTSLTGFVASDPAQIGIFEFGEINAGQDLPRVNQPDPNNPTEQYTAGIGFEQGVCLCTGFARTADKTPTPPAGFGWGAEGPNNAFIDEADYGEASKDFLNPSDFDFNNAVINVAGSGDPAPLEYVVDLPMPGFIQVNFVYATDEYPTWTLEEFNDSAGILIDGVNILTFRQTAVDPETMEEKVVTSNLTLHELLECPKLFELNKVPPKPQLLAASDHAVSSDATDYYDHEYGFFTKALTRESGDNPTTDSQEVLPSSPGLHTIKVVVQDIADPIIDAAIFIPDDGIKFIPVLPADFNLDGAVDGTDFNIWNAHLNQPGSWTFAEGDANFDTVVDGADFVIWWQWRYIGGGFAHFEADFNRDGIVDGCDLDIWIEFAFTQQCASRYEGDANGDGAVDGTDFNIWLNEYNEAGQPVSACD